MQRDDPNHRDDGTIAGGRRRVVRRRLARFLSSDLNFLRLMQRGALGNGSRITEFFGSAVAEGLAAVGPAAEKAGIAPERLVLDLTALCWYPFAHEHTLLPVLGMKPREPEFLDEQKRHIGDIVRAMTGKAEAPS